MRVRCAVVLVVGLAAMTAAPRRSSAQSGDPRMAMQKSAQDAMVRFGWLEGEWEGPATVYTGERQLSLTQRESVQRSAQNTALIVQGRGSMRMGPNGPEREVFGAAGIFTYDGITGKHTMFSASGMGQAQQFTVELHGADGLIWGYQSPSGERVRYTITRTSGGQWHEVGESSRDGSTWSKTIEMTLTRKP